jgi:hypothetical protein
LAVIPVAVVVAVASSPALAAVKAPPKKVGTAFSAVGIGALKIGISRSAVVALLGKPSSTPTPSSSDTVIQYDYRAKYGLVVSLGQGSSGAWQVGTIEMTSPQYQFQATGLRVGSTLAKLKGSPASIDCFANDTSCVMPGDGNVTFALVGGKVVSIAI